MKISMTLVAIAIGAHSSSAFMTSPTCKQQSAAVATTTALPMGLFDFFSEDARKAREAKKQKEVEEMEQYQREILDRRANPEKMEEYEAKIRVRRQLRMSGDDEAASSVEIYSGDDK